MESNHALLEPLRSYLHRYNSGARPQVRSRKRLLAQKLDRMTYGAAHRLNGLMILGLLCLFVAYRNPHPQTIADLIGKRVDILSDSLWAGCRSMAIERIKARL